MSCWATTFGSSFNFSTGTRIPNSNTHAPFSSFLRFGSGNLNVIRIREPTGLKGRRFAPCASSLELPLLPFNMNEVLVPSESKTLHLYEARYLALLEESLSRTKKLFVHFVLDPIAINDTGSEASFAARYGCLVLVQNVERLDVGALVSIRGIGRIKLLKFVQADPYLKGEVLPIQDRVPESASELGPKIMAVKEALYSLNSLEMKLKAPKEASLQTRILNSLNWAEKEPCFECNESFIPSLAERVSFAALQPVSGSTQSELVTLQQEKLRAMDLKDTPQRLDNSIKLVKQNISMVAAKLAIQSLEIYVLVPGLFRGDPWIKDRSKTRQKEDGDARGAFMIIEKLVVWRLEYLLRVEVKAS